VKKIGGNAFLNRFLILFCKEERKKKMECPVCKSAFSKVEEILFMVNGSFYCVTVGVDWSPILKGKKGTG